MSASAPWPHGKSAWVAFAAALNARMERLQVHVEPDWLFAVCTSCGWDLECSRPEISRFRFEVAAHQCQDAFTVVTAVPAVAPVLDEVLF